MIRGINIFYKGDSSGDSDTVIITDSLRELLNKMGTPGTWETVTTAVDTAKIYTNTNSSEYSGYLPREMFGEGLNLDADLQLMQNEIIAILNDIKAYLDRDDEIEADELGDTGSGRSGSYDNTTGGYVTGTDVVTQPDIVDGSEVPGAEPPVVTGDDTSTQTEILQDVGLTEPPTAEVTTADSTSKEIGKIYVDSGSIKIYDKDGNEIDVYNKGKYAYYEIRYDENGNPIAYRISPDGEEEKWIYAKDANDSVYVVENGQTGNYVPGEDGQPIYDGNGNQVGTTDKDNYIVYEKKYDKDGNVIAVRISPDGEDERWIYTTPGKNDGYYYEVGQKGNYFLRDGTLSIYDENGNVIGTATAGSYNVYGTKVDENGNIIGIKISPPGEDEKWIFMDPTNTNGFYMGMGQQGIYQLSGASLKIYDNQGNVIGTLNDGSYSVFDVKYDENGNPVALRISPNGAEEQWINIIDDQKNVIGSYKSLEELMKVDKGKAVITVTKKNNNALKYLGILGVLSVALGTTLVVRKKLKNNDEPNEYEDDYDDEPLEPGDYNVYEFKRDENNNITDARISEESSKDDLWVHF